MAETVNSNEIDNIISTEIPDPAETRSQYEMVKSHMVTPPSGTMYKTSFMKTICLPRDIPVAYCKTNRLVKIHIPHKVEENQN